MSEPVTELVGPSSSLSYEECMLRRAADLLLMKRSHYFIGYSGGIDSTALLVAILRSWSLEDQKKISIVLTRHSIEENPSFFQEHLLKFPLVSMTNDISQLVLQTDGILVTGELGDQLFGSDLLMNACEGGDSVIGENYADGFIRILEMEKPASDYGKKVFEIFHPIVEECPFPIRTTHDFVWWWNFTQKWQRVKYRNFDSVTWDYRASYGKYVVAFYDTAEFQKWSLSNHDLKIRSTWESYKWLPKQFIHRYTKDDSHLRLLKRQSLKNVAFLSEKRLATTSDFEEVSSIEELESYAR